MRRLLPFFTLLFLCECFDLEEQWRLLSEHVNTTGHVSGKIELRRGAYGMGIFATEEIEFDEPILTLPKTFAIGEKQVIQVGSATIGSK